MPTNDRSELQRRLEQTRRIVSQVTDSETVENLNKLVAEIEEELRKSDGSAEHFEYQLLGELVFLAQVFHIRLRSAKSGVPRFCSCS